MLFVALLFVAQLFVALPFVALLFVALLLAYDVAHAKSRIASSNTRYTHIVFGNPTPS